MTEPKKMRATKTEKNVFTTTKTETRVVTVKKLKIFINHLPVHIPKGSVKIEMTSLLQITERPDDLKNPISVHIAPLGQSALVFIDDAPWLLIVYPELVRPKKSKYWHLKGQARYCRFFKL